MLNLPQKTLDKIKKTLTKEKSEVEKNLKEVEKEDPAKAPALIETSEPGTDSYIADAHTKTLAIEQQLKNTRKSIKEALSKIAKGTYGKCENCGKKIEILRLFAIPIAKYCLSCSKKITK